MGAIDYTASANAYTVVGLDEAPESLWPHVAPFLGDGPCADWRADDIKALAARGQVAVYAVMRSDGTVMGAAVGRIDQFPRCRVLHVLGIVGRNFEEWLGLALDTAATEARAHGCGEVRVTAGPGAVEIMEAAGYEVRSVVFARKAGDAGGEAEER